jgi:hypothetical protein
LIVAIMSYEQLHTRESPAIVKAGRLPCLPNVPDKPK